ncbi:hypothetical protein AWB91_12295 [Mycobacterium paraense]|uniref:DUF3566 domain-containing protein n=1 Tax=Mycobacterium paraense TaxID=767916 RepID=A0ABX3VQ68_9MYCO|nr:DUF3566 domain-containing protein [Mycobacterium paraense]ORW32232.1 hypothetical protein AWB91_12295 [Mycobacterium paraense]ORW35216.1 hypothetical protein AWB88_27005 [Mycobacterium paraense]
MTSPNEPVAPDKGDGLNGDRSVERAGAHRAAPAQAGGLQGSTRPSHAAREPEPQAGPRPGGSPAGAEARTNRVIFGTAAPGGGAAARPKHPPYEFDAAPARGDGPPAEAYASELPDLSGPLPRPPQRKPAPERSAEAPGSSTQSARTATAESRENREGRENRIQVSRRSRGPVRASMQIRRIDPWSTLKVSLLLSVALFFVWMIAVAFLYLVLGGMGVWAKLNSNVGDLLNNTSGSSGELVSSGTIFGGAVLIGLVNIVLLTAMATIAAFVYNLATDLIGGIEVTLADRD